MTLIKHCQKLPAIYMPITSVFIINITIYRKFKLQNLRKYWFLYTDFENSDVNTFRVYLNSYERAVIHSCTYNNTIYSACKSIEDLISSRQESSSDN